MDVTASWWRDPAGWLLACWGALLAGLAFPPATLWPLAVVGLAPLWIMATQTQPRRALARGWLYGFGFYLALLWWIVPTVVRYGGLPWPAGGACLLLLAAYLALYPAISGWAVARCARRSRSLALLLAPVVWTGAEWLRGVALSGFPWGDLPQALWRVEGALALAPWVGIAGVRLLLAACAAGLAWLWLRSSRRSAGRPRWWAAVPAVLSAALLAGGALGPRGPVPTAGSVAVGVVQGNIDQAQKWDPDYRRATLQVHAQLTRDAAAAGARLVIWPETAAPFYAQEPGPARQGLEALARELGIHLVFGAPAHASEAGRTVYRNAVFVLDPAGELRGRYDKFHLVPFGEYVPFSRFLPFLKKLVQGAGDFSAGPAPRPIDLGPTLPALGPLICFEVIFPTIGAAHAAQGAQLLVVLTNDGWFGRTAGPHQHLAFAAWRAAESGLPLVRAANTGISAVFDAGGRLLSRGGLGERLQFVTEVRYPAVSAASGRAWRALLGPGCLALAVLAVFAILPAAQRGGHGNRL